MPQIEIDNLILGDKIKIAISLMAQTKEEVIEKLEIINTSSTDIIEWRLDYYKDIETIISLLEEIHSRTNKCLLLTLRRKEEGGVSELTAFEYEKLLLTLIHSQLVKFIDVEWSIDINKRNYIINEAKKNGVKVVLSAHYFQHTPSKLEMLNLLYAMENSGADLTKIAVMPKNSSDLLQLLAVSAEMQNKAKVPYVTIAMGELGKLSRIGGHVFGSAITFASLEESSAPGQIHINQLREILSIL